MTHVIEVSGEMSNVVFDIFATSLTMVGGGMMFSVIIGMAFGFRRPINVELMLMSSITKPVVTHVP